MGRVRSWEYDSVIGVGGMGAGAESHGIAGKINWIGIGPHKRFDFAKQWVIVTFERFRYFGAHGPSLFQYAPRLAHRIYSRHVRVQVKGYSESERKEIACILALAADAGPSRARSEDDSDGGPLCPPKPRKPRC
jgi:hypothetical protein